MFLKFGLPPMQIKYTHSFFSIKLGGLFALAKMLIGILPLHAIFLFI